MITVACFQTLQKTVQLKTYSSYSADYHELYRKSKWSLISLFRFFVKQRMSKKPTNAKVNVNKLNHVMGPKAFVLERLLAIFYAIHEEPERCVLANLFAQISSLVSKNYLVRHGAEMLDQPKYMCIAKYEFVAKCAKQIQFDFNEHLYDFAVGSCSNV